MLLLNAIVGIRKVFKLTGHALILAGQVSLILRQSPKILADHFLYAFELALIVANLID